MKYLLVLTLVALFVPFFCGQVSGKESKDSDNDSKEKSKDKFCLLSGDVKLKKDEKVVFKSNGTRCECRKNKDTNVFKAVCEVPSEATLEQEQKRKDEINERIIKLERKREEDEFSATEKTRFRKEIRELKKRLKNFFYTPI